MPNYDTLPSEWFTSRKRPRSYQYLPPMSRPVSKSFNRISDFIFPDTVHICLQQQQPIYRRYQRNENYSLPVLNRRHLNQRDLIVVERLPFEELDNVDLLYREQYQRQQQEQEQQRYQPTRQVRRRYSSIIDEHRPPFDERMTTGLTSRSAAYRERIRDRRKRHTTDNAYHSMMKSMLEEDESQFLNDDGGGGGGGGPNYILSYTTTLDPISDSESMASIHHHQQQQQHTNDISLEEWKRQTHVRVPINGTVPVMTERERPKQRQRSSSLSSRDSSSDTDITERHPTTMNYTHYQQDSAFTTSSKGPPAASMPGPAVWERLQSNPVRLRHQPDIFIPIIPAAVADTNNQETMSYSNNLITSPPFDNVLDNQINNQNSSQQRHQSAHHVSLCVNDLHTTLFIDEDALNSTKTTTNSNNNGGKAVIKTFIDRIIKRLQHFKRSLDGGLIHVRKRNTLVNGPIITADHRVQSEITKRKNVTGPSSDDYHQQTTPWSPSLDSNEDNKLVRPYFLIKPQSVLVLPNEIAKFKCCFGGDPLPTIVWSHNDSRVSEILTAGGSISSQYRTHKLHDIYYLDIGPVSSRDNGQIKCIIMNRHGREEAIAQLIVATSASDATPRIAQPLTDITIIEARPLKLSCGIVGLQVTVNWFHNGKLISPMTQSKTDYNGENAIFSLSRCMRTDAGTVDCLVKNRFGEARTSCRIEVVNDPEFDRLSCNESSFENILDMTSLLECRFLHRALTIDDISKKPNCKNLKFKRAFQFLQLLLIQRVYGIDVVTPSAVRRSSKYSQREEEQEQQQQNYQVFLGGSCNPTTWRHDQAIPYFQSRSVSFYNPQVPNWTPDLVEIEHRAKELAPLLFFVIDYDTRALASIIEVCYLAARGRSIIVVMNPMPDKKETKFISQKTNSVEKDDEDDYENVCEARQILQTLLRSINIPVFDNVRLALECAAYILETTKRTVTTHSVFDEDNKGDDSDQDILTPLPRSPGSDYTDRRGSSVVVIRSLSNKTAFESPDEFYQQMHQSEIARSSPISSHRRHHSTPESNDHQFRPTDVCTKSQISCSTNESDDDGYGSLSSSNRTLSVSTSSISSEPFEGISDQQRDDNSSGSHNKSSLSVPHNLISTLYSYVPFVSPSKPSDSSVTQSLFVLFTLPFRFIKDTLLSATLSLPPPTVSRPLLQEPVHLNLSASISPLQPSSHMFDLYIASGEHDECWLNTFALPTLEHVDITYTKRQSYRDNDQFDPLYDIHVRKQSRVLYYLINSSERLSHLATELAFLIGERQHKIIVYLQTTIDDDSKSILSACERRDLSRSRKYLEDLARKENITLSYSREQSWQHILAFFRQDD